MLSSGVDRVLDGIKRRKEKKEQKQDKKTGIVEKQRTTPKNGKVLVKNHTSHTLRTKCRE